VNLLTLQEIICLFKGSVSPWIALLICLSLLIEITPIKFNPLSWIAKKLGEAFNRAVMKEIGDLKTEMGKEIGKINTEVEKVNKEVKDIKKDVSDIREEAKEREATNRRTRILEFGDEILHDTPYSKEHWDSILIDCSEYEHYCDDHPRYMNNVAKATIRHIKHMYDKHLEADDFL
jgi:phosphoenolpyruvate-protein kinase (PTS system EI component)